MLAASYRQHFGQSGGVLLHPEMHVLVQLTQVILGIVSRWVECDVRQ